MTRLVIVVTMVALIAAMIGCGPTTVTFTDANLEAAVRDAIAIPTGPIYSSDLVELTYLDASERNITDLTGLECCTSLIRLFLYWNQISILTCPVRIGSFFL